MCEQCSGVTANRIDERRAAEYAKNIRGVARGLWQGALDFDQAFELMLNTIRIGLTQNWYAGALQCGVRPADISPQERAQLNGIIFRENNRVAQFLTFVEENNRESGAKLATVITRADIWGRRGLEVQSEARVTACGDQKLVWRLGATEEHCEQCAALDGKVKRASYWERSGLRPQNPPNAELQCGGWNCDCRLEPTDLPLSKGPLPRR